MWSFHKYLFCIKKNSFEIIMYPCKSCKKISRNKNEYLSHCDSHSTTSKHSYPCCFCNIIFNNRKSFYNHMGIHEKNDPKPEKMEVLCKHCKLMFPSITEFETHIKSFQPDIKIPCPWCKKPPFRTLIAYRVHKFR